MKTAVASSLPIISLAVQTEYVPTDVSGLISASHLPNYDNIGALGEAFHNAWRHCHDRTNDWIINTLNVATSDPSFDNGYYVEYGIKSRIPETYRLLNEMLGENNFWDTPEFAKDSLDITWGSLPDHAQYSDSPANYALLDELSWVKEKNRPNPADKTIPNYDGQALDAIKTFSDGWKDLKALFYNVQQISYYCDFTLESAQLSFLKLADFEKAKIVERERRNTRKMWRFILRKQVAPLRWNLRLWTRFNIAESAVHKMKNNFVVGWPRAVTAIERLPVHEISQQIGLDYNTVKGENDAIVQGWVQAMDNWSGSCYPAPADRTIKTGDKICQRGLEYKTISKGEKDSKAMWKDFFRPILRAYKKSDKYDQDLYKEVYETVYSQIYGKGEYQSFRLEFQFIRTRVRYFEIIPNWEIERVRDEAEEDFQVIVAFRNQLVNELGVEPVGMYSEETLNEMTQKKDQLKQMLTAWAGGRDEVYDAGTERKRNTLRKLTSNGYQEASLIYQWHWGMAWDQMEWKEGKPHDMDSANFKWTPTSRVGRKHYWEARRGYRNVAREMKKFNFHLWRRI